ncbi:MAG: UDP-galactopyranose mutase [Ruminococcaceae bacterium]|nr:UDP-galactopyranose mutase [Oscillospiraceae bacterium]
MKQYDYLIVGAGLFGAVFAHEMKKQGKRCLVLEKRNHTGGNIYCEKVEDITVHKYGAHIFHTSNERVWNYVNSFCEFNNFINTPMANFEGKLYNLPFNMNTFSQIFGVTTPEEAKAIIEEQRSEIKGEPKNLEEQAISLVGREIYTKLVKGYTEKQWGRDCKDLPAFIIKRLPVRYTYDNNYFNDTYQGIPVNSYNELIDKLLDGVEVRLNTDFLADKDYYLSLAEKCVYTGTIDGYFDYALGNLDYRSLRFETETLDMQEFQPVAVVNYNERQIPYTRIIEHKHFEFGKQEKTVITREYPANWEKGDEPYYPVNDDRNNALYERYKALAENEKNVIFGGRLGQYKYFDMDKCIESALEFCEKELSNE